jgi:glycosyltransferase involved in cell wall biosynthesis
MNLLYIDPTPVPGTSPPAMQILSTIESLCETGVQVTLLGPNGECPAEQVIGHPIGGRFRKLPLPAARRRWFFPFSSKKPFLLAARYLARYLQADAVYVRNLRLAQKLLSEPIGKPVIFEAHEVFTQSGLESAARIRSGDPSNDALRLLEQSVYDEIDGLVTISSGLLRDVRERFGYAGPAAVLPDGVDLKSVAKVPVLAIRRSRPRLLYLGSLHWWKGVDVLVHAMQYLPHADLTIAGGDADRISELRALARSLGVLDRIEFMGFVPPLERFRVIATADICVLPSSASSIGSRYTSPLKLFEYMAFGMPIVAADVPAIREVLKHEHNCLLFDVGDSRSLAHAISRLIADEAFSRTIGAQAGRDAVRYDWSERGRRLQDFAQTVIDRARTGSSARHGERARPVELVRADDRVPLIHGPGTPADWAPAGSRLSKAASSPHRS